MIKSKNIAGASVDGSGSSAQFFSPIGITIKNDGSFIYITESDSNNLRVVTADGDVTTPLQFNTGTTHWAGYGLVLDPTEQFLFVTEKYKARIIQVTIDGWTQAVFAGSDGSGRGHLDGSNSVVKFQYPAGIAIDPATGDLIVLDAGGVQGAAGTATYIRGYSAKTQQWFTIAGSDNVNYLGKDNLNGLNAGINNFPKNIAITPSRSALYFTDTSANVIRQVDLTTFQPPSNTPILMELLKKNAKKASHKTPRFTKSEHKSHSN